APMLPEYRIAGFDASNARPCGDAKGDWTPCSPELTGVHVPPSLTLLYTPCALVPAKSAPVDASRTIPVIQTLTETGTGDVIVPVPPARNLSAAFPDATYNVSVAPSMAA